MKKYLSILLLSVCLMSWQANDSWRSKVSKGLLKEIDQSERVNCLILLKEQYHFGDMSGWTKEEKGHFVFRKLKDQANRSQSRIVNYLNIENTQYRPFYIVNSIRTSVDRSQLERLASFEEVNRITLDPTVKIEEPIIEESLLSPRMPEPEWGIQMIEADSVWTLGIKGEGAVIGGQDTGFEWDNPLLKPKYRGWNGSSADHNYNWHDAIHEISPLHGDSIPDPSLNPCGLDVLEPCDDHGHGTHTMGTMIGHDENNAIGVAPEAKWIACRNMERAYGSPSTYIECFEWFLAPYDLDGENPNPEMAPHVINNSWSCPEMEGCDSTNWDMMNIVVNNLRSAGIVVVVSAGNSGNQGCGSVSTPSAMFEGSFTVGATRPNDTIAGFSSRGPVMVDSSFRLKPNVAAPGSQVRSTLLDTTFGTWSGTSMAGPHVAGTVALMISANPQIAGDVEAIETILEMTAIPKTTDQDCGDFSGTEVPNGVYGYGRIDAYKAVELAMQYTSVKILDGNDVELHIIPNPFQNHVELQLSEPGEKVEIIDLQGKIIYQLTEMSLTYQLNTIGIESGIYLARVYINGQWVVRKLIKM